MEVLLFIALALITFLAWKMHKNPGGGGTEFFVILVVCFLIGFVGLGVIKNGERDRDAFEFVIIVHERYMSCMGAVKDVKGIAECFKDYSNRMSY